MSVTLPITDLSTATVGTVGTVDWAAQLSAEQYKATSDNAPHLWIFNESNCGLQLTFQSGEKPFLPAGGWVAVDLNPTCLYYSYEVAYIMTGPLVTSLVTVWFGPDEATPNLPALGNSPIGGTANVGTSQILKGSNDTGFGVTTQGLPQVGGYFIEMIQPAARNDGEQSGLLLGALDAAQTPATPQVTLDPVQGFVFFDSPALKNNGVWNQYHGEDLALNGLIGCVAGITDLHVNVTTLQTLATYTTPSDGVTHLYRVGGHVVVNNSVSGNNVSFTYNYTNSFGNNFTDCLIGHAPKATTQVFFTGTVAIANATYACGGLEFAAQPNTTITLAFQDPTNGPNDRVSVSLERLS